MLFSTTVGYGQTPNTFDGSYCPGPGVSGDEYAPSTGSYTTGPISSGSGTCDIKQIWAKVDTGGGFLRLGFKIGNSGTALFRLYIDADNDPLSGLLTDTFGGTGIPAGGAEFVLQINSNSGATKLFEATSGSTISEIGLIPGGLAGLNGNSTGCVGNDGQFLEFYIPFESIGFDLCDPNQPGTINIARYAAVSGGSVNSSLCSNNSLNFGVSLSGTVTPNQIICEGENSGLLTLAVSGGGLNTVTTWQSSTDGLNYSNVGGTAFTYSPGVLSVGTHYFRDQIQNLAICTSTFASSPAIITVNALPTLIITNPQAVCGGSVDLTNAAITSGSSAGVFTYFTDANLTAPVPNATAVTTGTYYIKLTNSNGCITSGAVVVSQSPQPVLNIINPAAVCSPSTVNLTSSAVTAGSTLEGGTLTYYATEAHAIAGTPTINGSSIAISGTYYIKVTTIGGCYDIEPVVVTIDAQPVVSNQPNQTLCNTSTFTMTQSAPSVGTGVWTLVSGTATITTPSLPTTTITGVAAGTSATVKWTVTNGTCSAFDEVTVQNDEQPVVSNQPNQTLCNTSTFTMTQSAPS
ncbi:MAG: hypothetical protein Q7J19_07830, partial [Lutibacter sp.]|nr:hypothetical protein [Lutibacter sp.]